MTMLWRRLLCRLLGHVEDSALIHTSGRCGHLTACVRCGAVLDTRIYEGRYPVPRGEA